MIKNFDLVFSINPTTNDTELSENFEILLFLENVMHRRIDHFRTEILNQLIRYEIVDYELIILQELFD